MATIEAQLELEHQLLQKTSERFHANNAKAADQGRGSDTEPSRRLNKLFIEDVIADLQEYIAQKERRPGVGGKYLKLLKQVDADFAGSVGLNEMFNNVMLPDRGIQDAMVRIGTRIEDEIKFTKFRKECPDYFDVVIRDFKTKGTTNYRHMHRVLTNKMNEFNVEWNDWTTLERVKVGEHVFNVILQTTPFFEIKKSVKRGRKSDMNMLIFTGDTKEWVKKYNDYAQYLHPMGGPCIIEPKPWEGLHHGGFYSPEMQSKFPFVKSRHIKHLQDADLTRHMQAVNKLQATAWQINPQVKHFFDWAMKNNFTQFVGLPASQPYAFPESPVGHLNKDDLTPEQEEMFLSWKRDTARLHTKERKRYTDALAMWRVSNMAEEYRHYDNFYFVYTTDFRGRIYPVSSGLSPQGADYAKGLLRFARGKELGADGAYWFRVHGANLLGFDKASYDERVAYINDPERLASIRRAAANPCCLETAKFIGAADKPLQFLAWCFEFAEHLKVGNSFVSHLPVGLDGSCNGLQNFSAILRDAVGGLATNVLPSDRPNDIYGEVARVAVSKLNQCSSNGDGVANKLLSLGITRKTTKRSVMTLPYGLTKHSSSQYIGDWLYENHISSYPTYPEYNAARNMLNDQVWDSIGEVVKAAREGMDWLQAVARLVGKEDNPLIWTTPTGFKVYQKDCKSKVRRVRCSLDQVASYSVREYTNDIDKIALRNGSAPNYVHSMDAAHLVLTVLESNGIIDWQMIHDDFGTYAADIPELHRAIRAAFFKMYDGIDRLGMFRNEIEKQIEAELPPTPNMGTMDISQVLESEYFFG